MSCPTCDHTLAGIGNGRFHCGRCGTLVAHPRCIIAVPALVERCRQFAETLGDDEAAGRSEWRRLGIEEAIDVPENRKGFGS